MGDLVALVRQYAPNHVKWYRTVKVEDEPPADSTVVFASGDAIRGGSFKPATLIVGATGCLPGLKVDVGTQAVLSAPADIQTESLLARGKEKLGMAELMRFFPTMSQADALLRLNRFASVLHVPEGA